MNNNKESNTFVPGDPVDAATHARLGPISRFTAVFMGNILVNDIHYTQIDAIRETFVHEGGYYTGSLYYTDAHFPVARALQ